MDWLVQARANGIWGAKIFPGPRTDGYLDTLNPDAVVLRAVDRLGNLSAPLSWTPPKYSPAVISRGMKK
jgi:hypothetical protein